MLDHCFDISDPASRHSLLLQYALGELPEESCDLLEAALEHDTALCEELTSVVRWHVAIAAALDSPAPRALRAVTSPARAVSELRHRKTIVGLACAALAFVVVVLTANTPQPENPLLTEAVSFADFADDLTPVEADDALVDESELDDPLALLIAPDWLVTAVALEEVTSGGNPHGSGPDEQELN